MKAKTDTPFGARFMLATLLAAFAVSSPALAQDADDELDALEPAVDTSALPEPDRDAAERTEAEPAVDTSAQAAIAADVSRRVDNGGVMDRLDLDRTEITGNQELPKVLYIVPWQKSNPGDLIGRPVNTLLDEVLAPVDREEFIREVDYYRDLDE